MDPTDVIDTWATRKERHVSENYTNLLDRVSYHRRSVDFKTVPATGGIDTRKFSGPTPVDPRNVGSDSLYVTVEVVLGRSSLSSLPVGTLPLVTGHTK